MTSRTVDGITRMTLTREQGQANDLIEHKRTLVATDDPMSSQTRPLPTELNAILHDVIQAIAEGRTITVTAMPDELTTSAAARLLGVSRPTLMKLVKAGSIPSHKVGSHHRLKTSDVLRFQAQRLANQRNAFDELRRLEEDLRI